jgi:hypothetical protein
LKAEFDTEAAVAEAKVLFDEGIGGVGAEGYG